MLADALEQPGVADRRGAVGEQRTLELGIGPRLGDDARAAMRANLGLVGLDQGVERDRIDIALLGQDCFKRAHAQLRLGQFGAVVMIVVVVGHGDILATNRRGPEAPQAASPAASCLTLWRIMSM